MYPSLDAGAYLAPDAQDALDPLAFGVRYDSYRNEARFLDQTADLDPGMIVWPGGTLAETRDDRYGLEYDGLYADWTGKPGIAEMFEIANGEGAALSVVIPTVRYVGNEAGLVSDLEAFMGDLLSGAYGTPPGTLVFEIGAEYYAHFEDQGATSAATVYGELAELAIDTMTAALTDPEVNLLGIDVTVAMQAGKTLADDADIRAALDPETLGEIDMIVHHRFVYDAQAVDARVDEVEAIVDAWAADAEAIGADAPELFVSAMNVVGLTREGVLQDWLDDTGAEAADVDLAARTNTDFEDYWQAALGTASYGAEHATLLLELFHSYAEAGMTAGSVFGTDFAHAGRLSWRDDAGQDHVFVGGSALEMIYESVEGLVAVPGPDHDPEGSLDHYVFENEDRMVIFLAAGETPPGEVTVALSGLGDSYLQVWGTALDAEVPEGWMETFGIVDNPEVDETAEGETYAVGVLSDATPAVTGEGLSVTLDAAHQIIRLSIAKTPEGAAEIAAYEGDDGLMVLDWPLAAVEGAEAGAEVPLDEDEPDGEDGGGGGLGFGIAGLFLIPLLWFL